MPLLLKALIALPIIYIVICIGIAAFTAWTRREKLNRTPADLQVDYEDVTFPSRKDKLSLRGWYMPGHGDKGSIIVIHGGKANRSDDGMELLEICRNLVLKGYNVLTYDRRGCGTSDESSLRARALFERDMGGSVDYIRGRNGRNEPLFLFGFSLGAIASILYAAEEPEGISGIICDSVFGSTSGMVKRVVQRVNGLLPVFIPGAVLMAALLFDFRVRNAEDFVPLIACPIFFIHGQKDPDIPEEEVRRLYENSTNTMNDFWVAPDSLHVMAYKNHPEEYMRRVTSFLETHCNGDTCQRTKVTSQTGAPISQIIP